MSDEWKSRFMQLRANHESMMKAEKERIIKELEAVHSVFGDYVLIDAVKCIIKGKSNDSM